MTKEIADPPLVVLCGGRGTRLRPATDDIPKALVPVNGQPIIDYIVNFFARKGVRDWYFCLGYRGEQVRSHLETQRFAINAHYSDSGEEAGILERIHALRAELPDRFVVAYCDTFIDIDLDRLNEFHIAHGAGTTLVTAPIQSPFGVVRRDEGSMASSFVEKPVQDYFIGYFMMERRLLESLPVELITRPDGAGIVELFQRLVDKRQLATYSHTGLNITFNTNSERLRAERELDAFFTLRESGKGRGE